MRILSLRIDDASVLAVGFGGDMGVYSYPMTNDDGLHTWQTHGISPRMQRDQDLSCPCCSVRLLVILGCSVPVREEVLAQKVASSTT